MTLADVEAVAPRGSVPGVVGDDAATLLVDARASAVELAPAPVDLPADAGPAGPAGGATVAAPRASAGGGLAAAFPAHVAATERPGDPASRHWALLIGINDHAGGPRDNFGSRQDAEELRNHLLHNGWRDDHVLLLTDRTATRANIVAGLAWLAERTTEASTVVFHYSGHSKKWYGRDHDGDGEITDEGLWPSDNRYIVDSELVALLGRVRAAVAWIDIAACESEGFMDPGLRRPGRVLTFSSTESQKSYEDPSVGNSVWGHYLVDQALVAGLGDADGDGTTTVEEAFAYAAPRATARTHGQRYGAQTPVIVDDLDGELSLRVPAPPVPDTTTAGTTAPGPTTPAPGDGDGDGSSERPSCLLCGLGSGRDD